jgi:hypothetical protein
LTLPSPAETAIEAYCRARPQALLWDGEGRRLLDVFSGKTLPLDAAKVSAVQERENLEAGGRYLVVVRDDGRQLALAEVGIAFAPVTAASGPLPDLPPVVCFRDLITTLGRLEHFLLDHPDEAPRQEHLALFLFCLAVVDGARATGFEVSSEERRLERVLGEIEARKRGGG